MPVAGPVCRPRVACGLRVAANLRTAPLARMTAVPAYGTRRLADSGTGGSAGVQQLCFRGKDFVTGATTLFSAHTIGFFHRWIATKMLGLKRPGFTRAPDATRQKSLSGGLEPGPTIKTFHDEVGGANYSVTGPSP